MEQTSIRALTDLYYDLQKSRIALENRLRAIKQERSHQSEEEAKVLYSVLEDVVRMEKAIPRAFQAYVVSSPVSPWLSHVKGIGIILAANLVSIYGDCSKFDTISKMWAYTGLHVIKRCENCKKRYFDSELEKQKFIEKMVKRLEDMAQRRKNGSQFKKEEAEKRVKGWICSCEQPKPYSCAPSMRGDEIPDWNKNARVLAFKIADSFIKHECFGQRLYKQFYAEELNKGKPKGKAYMTARRKVVKIFLANYWINARKAVGLPTRVPYVQEYLNHTDIIEWPNEK
jgi:Transposase IS116/IS110/IS902 family.